MTIPFTIHEIQGVMGGRTERQDRRTEKMTLGAPPKKEELTEIMSLIQIMLLM